jgi:hypothetical protein
VLREEGGQPGAPGGLDRLDARRYAVGAVNRLNEGGDTEVFAFEVRVRRRMIADEDSTVSFEGSQGAFASSKFGKLRTEVADKQGSAPAQGIEDLVTQSCFESA